MKALCYIPCSYNHIVKHGIEYIECVVENGIAYFPEGYAKEDEPVFYSKTVGVIVDGKEVYKYQQELYEHSTK